MALFFLKVISDKPLFCNFESVSSNDIGSKLKVGFRDHQKWFENPVQSAGFIYAH